MRQNLREALKNIRDFERLMTKIEVGSANARDLTAIKISMFALPTIAEALKGVTSDILIACRDGLGNFAEEAALIDKAISENAPPSVRDGGMINAGYDAELDETRTYFTDNKSFLQNFEAEQKAKTGIRALKVGFNRVFGYYIEVAKGSTSKVPKDYVRKQTLTNSERYITDELREFETKILGSREKMVTLEYNIFCEETLLSVSPSLTLSQALPKPLT